MRISVMSTGIAALLAAFPLSASAQTYNIRVPLLPLKYGPASDVGGEYDGVWRAQSDFPEYGQCSGGTQSVTYHPSCTRGGVTDVSAASCDPALRSSATTTATRSCVLSCGVPAEVPVDYYDQDQEIARYPANVPISSAIGMAKGACEAYALSTQYSNMICQMSVNISNNMRYVHVIRSNRKVRNHGLPNHYFSTTCTRN